MTKFKSRNQAVRWIQAQGYKVSQQKIYADTEKGLLLIEPDGTVTMTAVERYITAAQLEKPAAQTVESSIKADAKMAAELRLVNLKNERLEHEIAVLKGRYVEKTACEAEKVDLAMLLDALPRHILHLNLSRYLSSIGADPAKGPLFFDLFDEDFTRAVNQVCDARGALVEGSGESVE